MPTLVHLADERDSAMIKKNGIKIGKNRQGIFCMPVLQSFYLSHQWLRELKRNGANTFVGIYFKIDSKTKVFAGRYNSEHKYIELGEAIKEIKAIKDPLGYELIINRKIISREITKIKKLPQNIGWRYMPASNGKKPCGCDYCIKGSIKAKSIRQKYNPEDISLSYNEILAKLEVEDKIHEIEDLLCSIRAKKRNGNPVRLIFLLEKNSVLIDREIALTLKMYRHKETKSILLKLLDKKDEDTREYAADSLLVLYGKEIVPFLESRSDQVIATALKDWSNKE